MWATCIREKREEAENSILEEAGGCLSVWVVYCFVCSDDVVIQGLVCG